MSYLKDNQIEVQQRGYKDSDSSSKKAIREVYERHEELFSVMNDFLGVFQKAVKEQEKR